MEKNVPKKLLAENGNSKKIERFFVETFLQKQKIYSQLLHKKNPLPMTEDLNKMLFVYYSGFVSSAGGIAVSSLLPSIFFLRSANTPRSPSVAFSTLL